MAENNDVIIDVEVNTGGATENIDAVGESLENLGEGSNQAEKELADLESAFNRLGLDLKSLEPKLSAFEKRTISTFKSIANNSQATGDQIKAAFEQSLGKIKSPQALKQLEAEFDKLKQSGKLSGEQLEQLEKKLKGFSETAEETAEKTSVLDEAIDGIAESSDLAGSALSLLKNPITGIIGIIGTLATAYFSVNKAADDTTSTLKQLTGSQEKATAAMRYAGIIAKTLGTDVNETARTWVNFDNTMAALGQNANQSKQFFETLSYAILSTGGSMDDVNETVEEFREGLTEGSLSGENLEQILRERLPRAMVEMANATGMSVDELGEFLQSGADITTMLPLLEEGVRKAYGEFQNVTGIDSALNRVKLSFDNLFRDTTTGSMSGFETVINGIAEAIDWLNQEIEKGQADMTSWMSQFALIKDLVTGNISSLEEFGQKWEEINKTQEDDIKRIGEASKKQADETKRTAEEQAKGFDGASVKAQKLKKDIDEIVKSYNQLDDAGDLVAAAISKVGESLNFKKPKQALEDITSTIQNLRDTANLTETEIAGGLSKSFESLSDNKLATLLNTVNKEMEAGALSVNNYALKTALLAEQQKRTGEGSVAAANATKSLAEAEAATAEAIAQNVAIIGTEQQKLQASLAVKKEQLEVAQKNIALIIEERNALQQKYDADLKEQGGINNLSEGKKKEFEARKLAIDAKNEEIKQSLQVVDGLSREKTELENLTSNYARYIEVLKRSNQDEQFATELQGTYIDLRLRRAQAEQQLAEAMGDSATAAQKQKEADDLTIASASNVVAQQQKKLEGMKLEYEQTINNALGDGILTQAEQDLIQSKSQAVEQQQANIDTARQELQLTEEEIAAKQRLAEANKEASAAQAKAKENAAQLAAQGSFVTGIINGWEKSLGSLSEAALKTFQDYGTSQQKVTAGMTEMEIEIKKLDEAERNALRGHGDYGFVKWANDVALRAIEVKKAFYSQAQAADSFAQRLEAMSEGGKGNLQALIREAEGAKATMNLLDQTRLDALNSAIEGATQRLQQMRDAAQSALDSAERAYLQQRGDDKALLDLEYQKQKLELQKQIDAAREAGDQKALAALLKAKELNEKTYLLKKKELNENEKNKTSSSSNTNTTTTSPDLTKLAESIDKLANKGFGGGNLTINADVSGLMNEQFIRQKILPTFNKVQNNFR